MIESRDDLAAYLEADQAALHRRSRRGARYWLFDDVWRFQRSLRRVEYLTNCRRRSVARVWRSWRHHRLAVRLGFDIPPNVFGPGLAIAHYGSIVVSAEARVGARCRLHVGVNIGETFGEGAPTFGDDVFIGPGAKLFGPITIADGVKVGANAVVTRSCDLPGARLVGAPARPTQATLTATR